MGLNGEVEAGAGCAPRVNPLRLFAGTVSVFAEGLPATRLWSRSCLQPGLIALGVSAGSTSAGSLTKARTRSRRSLWAPCLFSQLGWGHWAPLWTLRVPGPAVHNGAGPQLAL